MSYQPPGYSQPPAATSTASPLSAEDLAQFESFNVSGEPTGPSSSSSQQQSSGQEHQLHPQPLSQPQLLRQEQQGYYHQPASFTNNNIPAQSAPTAHISPANPFLVSSTSSYTTQAQQSNHDTSRMAEQQQNSSGSTQPSVVSPTNITNPFATSQAVGEQFTPPSEVPTSAIADDVGGHGTATGAMELQSTSGGGIPNTNGISVPVTTMPHQEDKSWPTKDIIFRGVDRKIVMQDENGPCSLIAIANILLLRGDVELQPPDRPLVNYDYLSSLIAEYLLTRPGDASLEQALSLLPQTQYGLNLNPGFRSNESFYSSADGATSAAESHPSQLALFDLLGIKLYHGFLPDQSSPETYDLLIAHGSYDSAVDQVVRGDAIADQFFREAMGETGITAPLKTLKERGGSALLESKGWGTSLQKRNVASAIELSTFLDSNASQLTYPGLFALSALPEGTLCALFRFNHLSVLYRPKASELPSPNEGETSSRSPPPTLLSLLTDEAFLDEGLAIWESLADVDGSASGEVYDGRFRRRVIDQSARIRRGFGGGDIGQGGLGESGDAAEDADYALALQLHVEERDRIEQARHRRASRNPGGAGRGPAGSSAPGSSSGYPSSYPNNNSSGRGEGRKSGLFGALGKKNKKGQQVQQEQQHLDEGAGEGNTSGYDGSNVRYEEARRGAADDFAGTGTGGWSTGDVNGSSGDAGGKKKKDCVIM